MSTIREVKSANLKNGSEDRLWYSPLGDETLDRQSHYPISETVHERDDNLRREEGRG